MDKLAISQPEIRIDVENPRKDQNAPEKPVPDEIVLYQGPDGIWVTNYRISTAGAEFPLTQIDKIEASSSSFLVPEIAHFAGNLLMVAGPVLALLWICCSRGTIGLAVVCVVLGFLLIWIGTESKGYERRLVLSGPGFARTIFRTRRAWGKGWHLGETNEAVYWKLKEVIERALPGNPKPETRNTKQVQMHGNAEIQGDSA